MKNYKLSTLKKWYHTYSKADSYLLMYEYNGIVYGKFYKRIPSNFLYVRYRHGKSDLYINYNTNSKKQKMLKGSIVFGTVEELYNDKYNAGVMAEKLVYDFYGKQWHGKDNTPFYKAGDIEIEGQQVQIKYQHARMAYGATLKKLSVAP
jgi:hypothetical protein